MEYRLNKVDFELQQLVNDATKDGKVHSNKETHKINKDKRYSNENYYDEQLKKQKKKRIIVNAVKIKSVKIDAFRDKEFKNSTQGRFLDAKL